jgi:hypothetical protein
MQTLTLNQKQNKVVQRLRRDYNFYARNVLSIEDKKGETVPFIFNEAQYYLHEKLEEQLKKTDKIRALVLKGRQQGCSTYIIGRHYHKITTRKGQNGFLLSHESATTEKLFRMVEKFYNTSKSFFKPPVEISNRRTLKFGVVNGTYYVGTAGNKEVGRGGTIQLFHGSEAAFWQNTDELRAGLLQSVADERNTEIILESTANGMGNMFYDMWLDAVAGKSDYQPIFIPWYWQEEYRKEPHKGFSLTDEEREYKQLYKLDDSQIAWRRSKTVELGDEWRFKREYPANATEAFQSSGISLINSEKVMLARQCNYKEDKSFPVVMGVDPGREGDETVIALRRGRVLYPYFKYSQMDQMRLTGLIIKFIETYKPAQCFIDVGHGYGTIDRLGELGYRDLVTGVPFGSAAIESDLYLNKRAEMFCAVRDWINNEPCNIPDSDELHAELTCIPPYKESSNGRIQIERKEKIKETYGKSTNILDAIGLTFAFPVRINLAIGNRIKLKKANTSSLNTLKKMRSA